MTIETLTEEQRQMLELAGSGPGFDYIPTEQIAEALRIIDALTAENERLRAEALPEAQREAQRWHERTVAAEARLDAATALLERVQRRGPTRGDGLLNGDVKAFLANQPAAPLPGTPDDTVQVVCAAADRVAQPAAPVCIACEGGNCQGPPHHGRPEPAAPTHCPVCGLGRPPVGSCYQLGHLARPVVKP